jgi:hypothetical protein
MRMVALLLCGRLEEGVSVEKTTDGSKRKDDILRGSFAMVQANGTSTTMEAREARVAITPKSMANLVRRKDSGRQRRGVEALDEGVTGRGSGGNAEKTFSTRKMVALVGNTESRDATTSGVPRDVPQMIEAISGSSHGPTIHVSKKRSTGGSKSGLRRTKVLIEGRTRLA